MWIPSREESTFLVVGPAMLKMHFLELSTADLHLAELEVELKV